MQATEEVLARVAQNVFEGLAFVFALPELEEVVEPEPAVRASVHFEGPFSGTVHLTVPHSLLPELASNMLGDDERAQDAGQQRDAVGELANVICGNLLPELAGPKPVFTLSPPRVVDLPADWPETQQLEVSASTRILLETGWAEVALSLDSGSWCRQCQQAVQTTADSEDVR